MKLPIFLFAFLSLLFAMCRNQSPNRRICQEKSEWRDKNGVDSCSIYFENELCQKIIGKLIINSRLHKGAFEKDVFEGGVSSRWLEISKDSIKYYTPSGDLADAGKCSCDRGILKISWENGANLPKEATIYFNSPNFVELRYYDYPFSFNTMLYDSLQKKNNPTKIVGIIR